MTLEGQIAYVEGERTYRTHLRDLEKQAEREQIEAERRRQQQLRKATALPRAWGDLLIEREELLLELVADKAEGICGFRPMPTDVLGFLAGLAAGQSTMPSARPSRAAAAPPSVIVLACRSNHLHWLPARCR